MAFNNVPANGWPQIKKLEELDALAKKIDDMPVFSSTDRDWLDEWESKLPELPADPETDGVKVLTATTESGETVKSWEEPASGGINYSTTEQNTGLKWIDGRDIYQATVNFGALPNATTKTVDHNIADIDFIIERSGVAYNDAITTMFVLPHFATATASSIETSVNASVVAVTTGVDRSGITNCYVTFRYVKKAL